MTRRLRIEWEPGSKVTGTLAGPGEGPVGILLAHGAGAGQSHPFMTGLRTRLADTGLGTMTFDYPYMEEGRRAPDRFPRLLACHAAAFDRMAERFDRVVVAGKSMGGRVGGHLVAEDGVGADRIVFYGYPLVPMGSGEPRDTGHLDGLEIPILFVQGARDRLAPLELVGPLVERLRARLEVVPEGDHSYAVPKRTGLDAGQVLDRIAGWTVDFVG